MPSPAGTHVAHVLRTASGIDVGYEHAAKAVVHGAPVELGSALLKWYEVHAEGRPVPAEIASLARRRLQALSDVEGLGFVILHRCGADFYFLLVSTWRSSNELWETVLYKDGDSMDDFAPFPLPAAHHPTFCVWELVPVWHEQGAWVRFLGSARDEAAADAWLGDRYAGTA